MTALPDKIERQTLTFHRQKEKSMTFKEKVEGGPFQP